MTSLTRLGPQLGVVGTVGGSLGPSLSSLRGLSLQQGS